MNHANVLKVAARIDGLPYEESLDSFKRPKAFNMASDCGAACCISGWTIEIFLAEAQISLGLNWSQAKALFKPPGYDCMKTDGRTAAQVLRKMEAAGDGVTEFQIWEFWRQSWA